MANTTRQNSLLVNQDWTKVYQSFKNADFQSYDYQTLRKSMIDYLRNYYPEDFNDYTESSEYIALIDLIAFLGQSLAFRTDLNARENFIDTAERRDSILKLARLVSYTPKRNTAASGYLKFDSVQTTETVYDSDGIDLTNAVVRWNDATNSNWYEQFITVLNMAMPTNQQVGKPSNSNTIGDIVHDEYTVNTSLNARNIYPFSATVNSQGLRFEVVPATTLGKEYVYEVSPRRGNQFSFLYRNDAGGNSSVNTGFFLYFKQGELKSIDFDLAEAKQNNYLDLDAANVNNTDVWLFERNQLNIFTNEWQKVPAVSGVNVIYGNKASKSFQVNTRLNDQISLAFGDGSFAEIPKGRFTVMYRQSAGTTYRIAPSDLQTITVDIPYVSRLGRQETLTITASLKSTVANAQQRETIEEIRTKAPQQYYTQNRMVTGEDYNIFPYTNYSSVAKVKAVNRTSSGVSRYLDVTDTTGRYSSTNIFADDGIIYKESAIDTVSFPWTTTNEIYRFIDNTLHSIISSQEMLHFYYDKNNFERVAISLIWNAVTVGSSSSSGYFSTALADSPVQVGSNVTGNNSYITQNAIVVFTPPTGQYFDAQNQLQTIPNGGIPPGGRTKIFATLTNLVYGGSTKILDNGNGSVYLSELVPSGAIATEVIPAFNNSFSTEFTSTLIKLISSYTEFGIRYDQATNSWKTIANQYINDTNPFNNKSNTTTNNLDSSWLVRFKLKTGSTAYDVKYRGLKYTFESVKDTRFYFDGTTKIYDPTTGRTVNDQIKVLKVSDGLAADVPLYVYKSIIDSDGYINKNKIYVTFTDFNDDGVPDNPEIFEQIVGDEATAYTFYQQSYDTDQFLIYTPLERNTVVTGMATYEQLLTAINLYPVGQIFYAYGVKDDLGNYTTQPAFYKITLSGTTRALTEQTDLVVKTGRGGLYFQYKHNAPGNRRIDPSPANLIDLYILTKEYDTSYRRWALDNTGFVAQPSRPTNSEIRELLADLEDYKSISDAIVYNSAKFKPLFGSKADTSLQAKFKVIKNSQTIISDSEIRTQVLTYINSFFATANWDFGDTFYFSELATYVQQAMAPNVNSIVIVPSSASQAFGSLQQINSEPNEILISVATVDDIEVITSLTAAQIGLQPGQVNTL